MKFNGKALRSVAAKLMQTKFQQGWQWVVEFSGKGVSSPPDFEIYAKSIEHGGATIEYEEKQIGANQINSPIYKSVGEITLIIRDREDGVCEKFFETLANRVVNKDGTVNLPADYLFTMKMYRIMDDDSRVLDKTWTVSMGSYGGFVRSVEEVSSFVTFTATFKKYQALG